MTSNTTSPEERCRPHGHRRGTAYLLILIVSMLVLVIGLSALLNARARDRASGSAADQMAARLLAISAVDLALYELSYDADWRTTYTSGAWQPKRTVGDGEVTFRVVDETDEDLSGGPPVPVRLHGWGESHDAVQVCSVLVGGMGANILKNHDVENGLSNWLAYGGCTLNEETGTVYSGAAALKINFRPVVESGAEQLVTATIVNGASYYCEVWARPGDSDQTMRVRIDIVNDAAQTSTTYFDQSAADSTWTLLSGTLSPTWTGTLVSASWRVETATDRTWFYIDEAELRVVLEQPKMIDGTWRQEVLP